MFVQFTQSVVKTVHIQFRHGRCVPEVTILDPFAARRRITGAPDGCGGARARILVRRTDLSISLIYSSGTQKSTNLSGRPQVDSFCFGVLRKKLGPIDCNLHPCRLSNQLLGIRASPFSCVGHRRIPPSEVFTSVHKL